MADLEDPLKDYNGLSLFPQTFSSLSLPNPPPPPSTHDPLCLHNFLNSLPVRNQDKLIKEAERILKNNEEVSNPKMAYTVVSEDNNSEVVAAENAVIYPRGQRPGLDRKRPRPRFALLPNIRQPNVNLEPTLDFDKLKDPEEFFSAFDRLENAKKEIAKQTGRAFTDFDHYNVFNVPRSQRPGIEGRSRTAKYKHLYPSMTCQELSEMDILSNNASQQEIGYTASEQTQPANVASQELEQADDASQRTKLADDASQKKKSADAAFEKMELTGSILKVENRVNKLLDDLLASEELAGDGAIGLLQERLHIKPLHIEKLNLPELQDIQRIDFKASGVNLPKSRNIFSDITHLMRGTRSKTPTKMKNAESTANFGSPTPPKSPLASLLLLKKRIFQSNPSNDPFSADDIDQSPTRNASHVENITKNSDPVGVEKMLDMSGNLNPQINEENDGLVGSMSSTKVAIEDFTSLFKKHADENLTSLGTDGEISPRETSPVLDNNNVGMDDEVINENLSEANAGLNLQTDRPDELEDMTADVLQETVTYAQPDQETDNFAVEALKSIQNKLGQSNPAANAEHAAGRCPEIHDGAPEQPEGSALEQHNEGIQGPTVVSINKQRKAKLHPPKRLYKKAPSRRQSLAAAMVENQVMDGCPEYQDSAREQNQGTAEEQYNEKIQESSMISIDEQTREKSHPKKERKRKAFSTRQSLAGFGMSLDTGVRRSTRIKSRPLEYWKGERFLYGRIHESLATVIGIKYASPVKDNGSPVLKVKSFVSDEYKGLVEQASLY
ncbi:centromere protein C [Ricinus communis]|uniref:centromere protein C n=1 Tax=Ricinus communis TaxID=3988 RepID=UPI00201AC0C6|nr:centromere protein C [Ricinus communis]